MSGGRPRLVEASSKNTFLLVRLVHRLNTAVSDIIRTGRRCIGIESCVQAAEDLISLLALAYIDGILLLVLALELWHCGTTRQGNAGLPVASQIVRDA